MKTEIQKYRILLESEIKVIQSIENNTGYTICSLLIANVSYTGVLSIIAYNNVFMFNNTIYSIISKLGSTLYLVGIFEPINY